MLSVGDERGPEDLRRLRVLAGQTQEQIAEALGVGRKAIAEAERTGRTPTALRMREWLSRHVSTGAPVADVPKVADAPNSEDFIELEFSRPRTSSALGKDRAVIRILTNSASLYFPIGTDVIIDTSAHEPLAAQPMALHVNGEGSMLGHVGIFGRMVRLIRMDGSHQFVDLAPGTYRVIGRVLDGLT